MEPRALSTCGDRLGTSAPEHPAGALTLSTYWLEVPEPTGPEPGTLPVRAVVARSHQAPVRVRGPHFALTCLQKLPVR